MALRLLMLGPPGAGKGTQAVQIARDHGGDLVLAESAPGRTVFVLTLPAPKA